MKSDNNLALHPYNGYIENDLRFDYSLNWGRRIRSIKISTEDGTEEFQGNLCKSWIMGLAPPIFRWNPVPQKLVYQFQSKFDAQLHITVTSLHVYMAWKWA